MCDESDSELNPYTCSDFLSNLFSSLLFNFPLGVLSNFSLNLNFQQHSINIFFANIAILSKHLVIFWLALNPTLSSKNIECFLQTYF